jgi:hypothetical protein
LSGSLGFVYKRGGVDDKVVFVDGGVEIEEDLAFFE